MFLNQSLAWWHPIKLLTMSRPFSDVNTSERNNYRLIDDIRITRQVEDVYLF